ncbi:hypothetical protein PHYC_00298 [Phycisphaerales bacterium]|nr:hypothetical protein PHYC_00298 [Phycisphaerales bacterium]
MRRAHAALYSVLSASLAAHALAGPPGDYGDAPVGNNGQGIDAYPGVVARWDTLYNHTNTVFSPQWPQGAWLNTGATCLLGDIGPTTRNDSTMTPGLPENDCAPVILLYTSPPNPGANPLADVEVTVSTTNAHAGGDTVYLNIWIDQNRDGQWKDGYYLASPLAAWNLEWAVQDVPVMLPPGTRARVNTAGIRLENPLASVWLRVMVSDEPVGDAFRGPAGTPENFWDSTMIAAHNFHGEIEDHLLSFQNNPPGQTPVPGVWYRVLYNGIAPPPGGAKPACDLFYKGPWRVFTPKCAGGITFPLIYTSSDRNGGCGLAPALWGMYGLKHVAGIVGPPTVNVAAAFPAGAVMGAVNMVCPPPGGAPALPAAIPAQGARMASMTVPVASITGPGRINIFACYPDPPKRFRAYRAFFNHFTCGSIHAGRTVFEYPETGVTLAAATVSGAGQTADYCDFEYGGLEEDFIDPIENRPFPDPDFTNYTFNLHTPGSMAQLVNWDSVSPPNSLFLAQATYLVRPTFPDRYEAASVELWHRGSMCTVMLMSENGETLLVTAPEVTRWDQMRIEVPDGFKLDSIVVDTPGELNLDNVFVDLRETPAAPPPPACDPDVNCDGTVNGFDIEATEQAVNGDYSNFCQDSADLNGDGAENGFDIETEEQRVNGAPC